VKDPVALCADAVAAWHTSWLTALGLRSAYTADVWRALDAPPVIYFAAIALHPDTPADGVLDAPGAVCDPWQNLDLAPLGLHVWRREPWFVRPAAPVSDAAPPELEIVRVSTPTEVDEFEAVSVRGFGGEDDRIEPGTYHPATILDDEAMGLFLGRIDGRPVGASMGYRTEEAVGVFGVTTIASARRRGYGGALTRAAMLMDPGRPSVLAPSPVGENLYLQLGFSRVGQLSIWVREDPGL
jgi:hypothetical protein